MYVMNGAVFAFWCCMVDVNRSSLLQYYSVQCVHISQGLVSNHISDLNTIANAHQEFRWCYVILDEGHLIKNNKTKTSRDVRLLSRNKNTRRLLLTGTPIQNNMQELHALFDWATSSKLLGSLQKFLNRYGHPIEEGRQRNATEWTVKKAAEMSSELQK